MEFFLYLIYLVITLVVVSLGDYYFGLLHLSGKDTFEKQELTDWARIIPSKIVSIFESAGSLQFGLLAFGLSAFFAYVWTLTGGLIGSPHYTDSFGNYFFLSFLMPVLMLAFYSFISSEVLRAARISRNSGSFLARLLGQEIPLLSGIFISVIASNLAVYGLYHEISFLFVFPNVLILMVLLILRWNGKVKFGGIRVDSEEEDAEDLGEDS